MYAGIAFCDEPEVTLFGVVFQKLDIPVVAVRQSLERTVVAKEVNLFPSGFEVAGHQQAVVGKEHSLDPGDPGGIAFGIHRSLAAVRSAYGENLKQALPAWHTAHEQFVGTGAPEGRSEVLLGVVGEICPGGDAGIKVDDADAHRGIGLD